MFDLAELDAATPAYRSRMNRLTVVQRRVIAALAEHGTAKARDVAWTARADVHVVSMILGRMVRRHVVRVVDKQGRALVYELVDPRLAAWLRARRSPARVRHG